MKRTVSTIALFILFLSFCHAENQDSLNSYTRLQTDRYSYVSGDMAFLKIYGFYNGIPLPNQSAYVDLVTEQESFITGVILKMENGTASGFCIIPDSLATGTYYLRVYSDQTKGLSYPFWDKKMIYVSNRFGKKEAVYKNNTKKTQINSHKKTIPDSDCCDMILTKDTFKTRNRVELQIENTSTNNEIIWASLTVKPITPIEKKYSSLNDNRQISQPPSFNIKQKTRQGIILRGQVQLPEKTDSLSGLVIFLTLNDTIFRFYYSYPDEQGYFCFNLYNYTGYQDIYLSAYEHPNLSPIKDVKFEIINNFIISDGSNIPQREVLEYRAITDTFNVFKSIINKAYENPIAHYDLKSKRDTSLWSHKYMVGEFNDVVNIDDYIYLPNFIEISKEILPLVKYRNKNGAKITLFNKEGYLNNPLVFVDGSPLVEIEKLESWNSSNIKQIKVKTASRVYGDLLFKSGFVFIWTKQNNFWETTTSEYIFNYKIQCYQNKVTFKYPDYPNRGNQKMPDYRQSLYWNPGIVINNQMPVNINFYTSDETGDFEVLLHGVTSTGIPITISKTITIE